MGHQVTHTQCRLAVCAAIDINLNQPETFVSSRGEGMQSPAAHFTQLGTTSSLHVLKSDYEFHIKSCLLLIQRRKL